MMMKNLAMVLGTVALAGCGSSIGGGSGTSNTPRTSSTDTCNAAAYAGFIGQDSVVTLSIPEPKRSYRTDETVPTDFDPKRVSVVLDETDVIIAINCG
jgi:hypothetical protein